MKKKSEPVKPDSKGSTPKAAPTNTPVRKTPSAATPSSNNAAAASSSKPKAKPSKSNNKDKKPKAKKSTLDKKIITDLADLLRIGSTYTEGTSGDKVVMSGENRASSLMEFLMSSQVDQTLEVLRTLEQPKVRELKIYETLQLIRSALVSMKGSTPSKTAAGTTVYAPLFQVGNDDGQEEGKGKTLLDILTTLVPTASIRVTPVGGGGSDPNSVVNAMKKRAANRRKNGANDAAEKKAEKDATKIDSVPSAATAASVTASAAASATASSVDAGTDILEPSSMIHDDDGIGANNGTTKPLNNLITEPSFVEPLKTPVRKSGKASGNNASINADAYSLSSPPIPTVMPTILDFTPNPDRTAPPIVATPAALADSKSTNELLITPANTTASAASTATPTTAATPMPAASGTRTPPKLSSPFLSYVQDSNLPLPLLRPMTLPKALTSISSSSPSKSTEPKSKSPATATSANNAALSQHLSTISPITVNASASKATANATAAAVTVVDGSDEKRISELKEMNARFVRLRELQIQQKKLENLINLSIEFSLPENKTATEKKLTIENEIQSINDLLGPFLEKLDDYMGDDFSTHAPDLFIESMEHSKSLKESATVTDSAVVNPIADGTNTAATSSTIVTVNANSTAAMAPTFSSHPYTASPSFAAAMPPHAESPSLANSVNSLDALKLERSSSRPMRAGSMSASLKRALSKSILTAEPRAGNASPVKGLASSVSSLKTPFDTDTMESLKRNLSLKSGLLTAAIEANNKLKEENDQLQANEKANVQKLARYESMIGPIEESSDGAQNASRDSDDSTDGAVNDSKNSDESERIPKATVVKRNKKLQKQLETAFQENERLRVENESLLRAVNDKAAALQTATTRTASEKADLKAAGERLESENQRLTALSNSLQSKLDEAQVKNKELTSKMENLNSTKEDLVEATEELSGSNKKLKNNARRNSGITKAIQVNAANKGDRIFQANEKSAEEIKRLTDENMSLSSQIDGLNTQLTEASSLISALKRQVETLESQHVNGVSLLKQMKSGTPNAGTPTANSPSSNDATIAAPATATNTAASVNAIVSALATATATASAASITPITSKENDEALQKERAQNAALLKTIEELRKTINDQTKLLLELEQTIKELRSDNETLRNTNRDLDTRNSTLLSEGATLKAKNLELQQELKAKIVIPQNATASADPKINDETIRQSNSALQTTIDDLTKRNSTLQTANDDLTKRNSELQNTIDRMLLEKTDSVIDYTTTLTSVSNAHVALQNDYDLLLAAYKSCFRELSQLKAFVSSIKPELRSLTAFKGFLSDKEGAVVSTQPLTAAASAASSVSVTPSDSAAALSIDSKAESESSQTVALNRIARAIEEARIIREEERRRAFSVTSASMTAHSAALNTSTAALTISVTAAPAVAESSASSTTAATASTSAPPTLT